MSDPLLGFIGIGKMGQPMVMRLLEAGRTVAVFNRTAAKLDAVSAAGAQAAESAAAVAAAAEIVMLCLADDAAVEQIVFGARGVAAGGGAGKLLVDCSSISPCATREMAQRLKASADMRWVDAPVSGGVPGAREGKLVFMCGGEEADMQRVRPVLEHLGKHITHMGPVGSGQTTKLCNQAIVSCNLAVIAEAVNLAARAGVNAARLPEALQGGWADSLPLQIYGPRMAAPDQRDALGAIATMLKDMENVLRQGQQVDASMPMTERAAELYRRLGERGYLHADLENLVRLFDAAADS